MKKNKETIRRQYSLSADIIARGAEGSRLIEGYAMVYEAESLPWPLDDDTYVVETIKTGAVADEVVSSSDIVLTMFHDQTILLGRSNHGSGTLTVKADERGLYFSCEMPATAEGDKALEAVRRGDIRGCSFIAAVEYGEPRPAAVDDAGKIKRTAVVERVVEIFELTLTPAPAYPDTEAVSRQFTTLQIPIDCYMNKEETITRAAELEEAAAAALDPAEIEGREPTAAETAAAQEAIIARRSLHVTEQVDNNQPEKMKKETLTQIVRSAVNGNKRAEFLITRATGTDAPDAGATGETETMTTGNAAAGGLIPLRVQQVIAPLVSGIIWTKLGIPVSYSNSGELVWPVRGTARTSIVGEKEAVVPQTIELSKITMRPERFACSVECTYESLYQSDNAVENIIRTAMAESVQAAINKLVMSVTKPDGSASITGPLVGAAAKAKTLKAVSLKELLVNVKAPLLKAGVDPARVVWTMSDATRARLEGTPIDEGSGRFLIENDRLCGFPVFTSSDVDDDYVALGDWSNQAAGFFGEMRMIVNPYSGDTANVIRFTLNFGFGTQTLRSEAFVVAKLPAEA